ncbi:hypothetical protein GOODEAATRI_023112 [Goodea atripinnis]|uniref:C2H2-type domain-containing protein n=1 Tax=Goodea atripinnis TaxID=208336 RepID=A0ABV0ND90_9TELE
MPFCHAEQKSDEELLEGLLTEYYCHVCSSNLLFESNRLAHYEGQKHAQELKTYLNAVRAELARGSQENDMELHPDPKPTSDIPDPSASWNAEVDLKHPDKCILCAASFNNPKMALQHYNGRKHQRKKARQELLKELGKDLQQGITRHWIYIPKGSKK